jgi:hypothetical protein
LVVPGAWRGRQVLYTAADVARLRKIVRLTRDLGLSCRRPRRRPIVHDWLHRMDAYWRAANYLTVGQIYLQDNPLLREPLQPTTYSSPPTE